MSVAVVTGSSGLIGSEAAYQLVRSGYSVVGIDNDMRASFFGHEGSTQHNRDQVQSDLGASYRHVELDIRDRGGVARLFDELGSDVAVVVHTAAQPAHDWASEHPMVDFDINAVGTLNMLEAVRIHAPAASFIFTSSSKVYGDHVNRLDLVEQATRWELPEDHPLWEGVSESMSIDNCMRSLLGSSKAAADVLVQEYGRYFGLRTTCIRGNCLSGGRHSAVEHHGFLAYLMRCAATGRKYTVFGYKGKQVRDNIHSHDYVSAVLELVRRPPSPGEIFNLGGGRSSNCSVLEALEVASEITGSDVRWKYHEQARRADHVWYITDMRKFREAYPDWTPHYDTARILREIHESNAERWAPEPRRRLIVEMHERPASEEVRRPHDS